MPFTTPLLAAARVRESSRTGVELILANPAGGKGCYVINWAGVRALCAPTLHDTLLFQRITQLTAPDPRSVRDAALALALEGHAGQEASAAAKVAVAMDRRQRTHAQFLLLKIMVDPRGADRSATRTPEFDHLVIEAFRRLGAEWSRPAPQLAAAMAGLGDAFGPVGVAPDDRVARIPRLIELMEDVHTDLLAWLALDASFDLGGLGQSIDAAMRAAIKGGRATLMVTRRDIADPLRLLKRRLTNPSGVAALAERCTWLLDGWETICLIWQVSLGAMARRGALLDMARCLPVIPQEAYDWTDPEVPLPPAEQPCRVLGTETGGRAGSASFMQIERNEKLRGMRL